MHGGHVLLVLEIDCQCLKKKKGSEALNDLTLKMINRRIPVLLQMIYHYYTIAIESTGAYSQVKILLGFHARD